MKQNWWKLLVVMVLVVVVGVVLANKDRSPDKNDTAAVNSRVDTPAGNTTEEQTQKKPEVNVKTSQKPDSAKAEDNGTITAKPVRNTKEEPKAETAVKPVAGKKEGPKPVVTKEHQKSLPKMIELGAEKCVPCKMMKPVVEELQKEYKDKLEVMFIDVSKNSAAVDNYDIQSIPTQIFFDKDGKEFFRHTGVLSREDILKTFEEHGIKLN